MIEDESGSGSLVTRNLSEIMECTAATQSIIPPPAVHPVLELFDQVSACRSREDAVQNVAVVIADWLQFTDQQKEKLVTALQSYFEEAEIGNDRLLTAMEDKD